MRPEGKEATLRPEVLQFRTGLDIRKSFPARGSEEGFPLDLVFSKSTLLYRNEK